MICAMTTLSYECCSSCIQFLESLSLSLEFELSLPLSDEESASEPEAESESLPDEESESDSESEPEDESEEESELLTASISASTSAKTAGDSTLDFWAIMLPLAGTEPGSIMILALSMMLIAGVFWAACSSSTAVASSASTAIKAAIVKA
jgi:hypothetical protein